MSIQCIITGCALVNDGRWVAGDLFDAGSHYVFNGNMDRETSAPEWLHINSLHYNKRLEPSGWFEKRGVFVINKVHANLNEAACEYIIGSAF